MSFDDYELELLDGMESAIENYKGNLQKISTGRANPNLLDSIKFNYYGEWTPISQAAQISVPEPRQLLIKPFDMSTVKEIYAAINASGMKLNVVNEGDKVRIKIAELTTETRKQLVKSLSTYTEQARVQVRSVRQAIKKQIDSAEGISEDDQKRYLDQLQKITDKYIALIDELTEVKEKDLMTI